MHTPTHHDHTPEHGAARYDAVEGRAPSARTQRVSAIVLGVGLFLMFLGLVAAASVLCVIAGFGIELVAGGFIAMLGVAPVVFAGLSRKNTPEAVPAPAD